MVLLHGEQQRCLHSRGRMQPPALPGPLPGSSHLCIPPHPCAPVQHRLGRHRAETFLPTRYRWHDPSDPEKS